MSSTPPIKVVRAIVRDELRWSVARVGLRVLLLDSWDPRLRGAFLRGFVLTFSEDPSTPEDVRAVLRAVRNLALDAEIADMFREPRTDEEKPN